MSLILVIDDEEMVRKVVEKFLRLHGHEVVAASDGEQGIDLFQRQLFDLVITDVRMPGLKGPEVINAVRALRPTTRTIVMGGGTGSVPGLGAQVYARQVGADRALHKPFSIQELNAAVSELLHPSGSE